MIILLFNSKKNPVAFESADGAYIIPVMRPGEFPCS
jgi:hypothetical protein